MEIKDITFAYQDKVNRLHQINSEIKQGEITTIIGPNGSGKSTLLGVMTNHHQAQKGQIILDGKDMNQYKLKELAKIVGVVHQKNTAPADITVEALVYYGRDRKSTRLNSSHVAISYAVFCLKKKNK